MQYERFNMVGAATLALVSVCLGGLAMSATAGEVMLPRTVERATSLVIDGQSEAVIVYPSIAQGRALGETVQKVIAEATGVTLTLAADTELIDQIPAWPAESYRRQPLIVLGNIHNNRAMLPLYGNLLAAADANYPGGDGYTVRTVVDPYGTGANQIVLGASSNVGLEAAAEAFAAIIKEHATQGSLVLPGIVRVVPGGKYVQIVAKAGPAASNYHWTGNEQLLATTVEKVRAAAYMKPETKSHNPGHYGKESAIRELIALIQTGALEPEEVNHIENILLAGLHEEYGGYWIVHGAKWLGTRHQTMGMMGFLVTADYLLNRAKPNAEAAVFLRQCVDEAHAYFHQFDENYRDEGNDNTSFDSAGPIGRYVMAYGSTRYFTSGAAKSAAMRALMMMDNRGWFLAPGNYEDVRQGKMTYGVDTANSVGLPAFGYGDGELRWIIENARGINAMGGGGWAFGGGIAGGSYPLPAHVKPIEPRRWLGVSVLPLQPYYYNLSGNYMTHGAQGGEHAWHALIPKDKAVEMITFRDRFDPQGQYLFLNGFQGGRYNSMDVNAILRYSDRGHIWLMAQTEQLGQYFRNALHVANGYRDDYFSMPGTIRLDASADFDDVGMTATTLPAYNASDWTRHILWRRGEYFVVIDTATFLEDGPYDLTCTWRSLPIADLEDNVWVARFMGSRFELHNADGIAQRSSQERAVSTEQLCVYPYVLRQHMAVEGAKGNHISVRNMFFTTDAEEGSSYTVRPVGKDAVLVADGGAHIALIGINMSGKTTFGPLSTDARMFDVSTESIRLTPQGSQLWLNGTAIPAGETTAPIRAALAKLWNETQPPAPGAPASPNAELKSIAWTFDQFVHPYEEIGGVNVIDPTGIELPDALFDRQALIWHGPYGWPKDTATVTYDLGRVEQIARMHLDGGYGVYRGKGRNDHWQRPGKEPMTLSFSDDNFKEEVRPMSLNFDSIWRQDPPYIYKPYEYAPKSWKQFPAAADEALNIAARYVRTPANDAHEIAFFRTATRPAQFDWLLPVDLDGDGNDELAVATEARQLVVLNADGTLRWSKTIDNRIADLLAIDLTGDGKQILLVADNGWYINGYDAGGEVVYEADCKPLQLAGAYALGSVIPKGRKLPYVTVATGAGATCLDEQGKFYCHITGSGIASDTLLAGTTSAPRAQHRTATRHAWGGAAWRDIRLLDEDEDPKAKDKFPGGSFGCYWWLGLGFEFWPEIDDPNWQDGLAVFVARAGVNAYSLGDEQPTQRWGLPANGPISCYTFADMDAVAGSELVLGRLDGFIHVVDRQGKVINTWPTGGPVNALVSFDTGNAIIAAAMNDSVRFYDRDGAEVSRIAIAAQRLVVLGSGVQRMLMAATNDGKVVALK
jgi:hypothetical protein